MGTWAAVRVYQKREATHGPRLSVPPSKAWLIEGVGLAALLGLALAFRLADPLSDPLIGGEDPFTHMVYVKEAAARGSFEGARALDLDVYPPGLHALVYAFWSIAGLDLYDVARFGPAVLGALAVVSVALLAREDLGPLAGLAAGVVLATMPEHVFRTTLLVPTVLDLLVLPPLLVAVERLASGRLAWGLPAAALAGLLVGAHPWAVLMFAPVAVMIALWRLAFPEERASGVVGPALALAGVVVAVASCVLAWPDTPYVGSLPTLLSARLGFGLPVLAAAVAPALAVALLLRRLGADEERRKTLPRLCASLLALGLLLVIVVGVLPRGLPPLVHYGHMLGGPAILLALAGLVAVTVRPSGIGVVGLAIVIVTLPLTAFDLFQSTFIPHRSVAYLAIGVAFLAGAAAAEVGSLLARAPLRALRVAAPAVALLVLVAATVPVAQGSYRWYRHYTPEEFGVVAGAKERLDADPGAVVVVGAWQPNLVLRAIADETRVVWGPRAFDDPAELESLAADLARTGRRPLVLVDHHAAAARGLAPAPGGPLPGFEGRAVVVCCEGAGALYDFSGA